MNKNSIKIFIKKLIGKKNSTKISQYNRVHKKNRNKIEMLKYVLKSKIYCEKTSGESFKKLLSKIEISDLNENDKFYYNIDSLKTIYSNIGNISIDYEKILKYSLEDYKETLQKNKKDEEFYNNELNVIEGIEVLINRIISKLENTKCNKEIINNIKNIKDKKTESFYETLQRILFYNQLLWQTGHTLNGLGRLDMVLIPYYQKDIEEGIISRQEAQDLLKEFLKTLHNYYEFKSSALLGDTGQIIELGGKDINGKYNYNELTYIFIELMEELQLPDPKVLLRVCSDTPRDLMEISLRCIKTGIGCPLFANDDIIIPKLIEFGYEKEDVYNYGTSACWEPYIIGKALDQNNISGINFVKPFETLLEKEDLDKIESIEILIKLYKKNLKEYLNKIINDLNKRKLQEDSLLSLFIDDCIKNNKDISRGGAKYNNDGLTGVGISNLINSIINVDKIIFKNKEMTLSKLNEIRKNNFENNEQILKELKNEKTKYGTDNEEIISLTNDIIKYATEVMNKFTNPLGGKYKFGLSAPSYIDAAKGFPASFDGRKNGEPFGVHISSDSPNAYTELIGFASKLDYGENRFNGNVVDFMVSPDFIENNFDKFVDFLMLSIKVGFFEMQMNVISSKILIEAKENPEKFPNLIVRVWGFSAYFNDLPDSYKDNLIRRALKNEGISEK